MSCARSERNATPVRSGNLRVGGGGAKDREKTGDDKTGDRRDVTLVFLYFVRKYSGYVPSVPGFHKR